MRFLPGLAGALVLLACGPALISEQLPDAGEAPPDGGEPFADAGDDDAGSTPLDGGRDAGSSPLDGGRDAGATPADGGRDAGCAPESNAAFCTRVGKNCGAVTAPDNCGAARTVSSCGTCTSPQTCGGGGTANVCGCTPESNAAFCARLGKNCGAVTAPDNCNAGRTVSSCGTCTAPQTCGGGGTANRCGCTPESNAAFCARLGKNCGPVTAPDNCNVARTVSPCGSCAQGNVCRPDGVCEACTNDGTKKFFGMFFSGAGHDSEGIENRVIGTPDRLTVVQDYQAPASFNVGSLTAAHARGNVVHLNVMPAGNTWDATVQQQVASMGAAIAAELRAGGYRVPGVLVTVGPEMNGTWTTYGCTTGGANAAAFLQLHNGIVASLRASFQAAGLEPARLRIVWGPNWSPASGSCGYANYWPGWSNTDFIGYSKYAFRSDFQSGSAIAANADTLLQAVGASLSDPAYFGRVLILQTGMEYGQAGHPRGTWFDELVTAVNGNRHLAGMVLFQSPDYYPNRPEPYLRWLDYVTFAPLEGFTQLQTEVRTRQTFTTHARFLFCN